jgi:hypothetical protein
MVDFTELPANGIRFEQLIRELLIRSDFEVHWTGVGPDAGKDLVVVERADGPIAPFQRRWLVSCKHKAHSAKSVGVDEVNNILDVCASAGATGFLLACSTQPSSGLVQRFRELSAQGKIVTTIWDGIEIEKRLRTPTTLPLLHLFFPTSGREVGWTIYNAQSPSFWAANFKDYFIYLSSRTANRFPDLRDVETIIKRLEEVKLPKGDDWRRHYLRPRAVYFDNKNEDFSVFVDYLFPKDAGDSVLTPQQLNEVLHDGEGLYSDGAGSWYRTYWDVRYVATNQVSDHFHLDHKDYYDPFLEEYRFGSPRSRFLSDLIH